MADEQLTAKDSQFRIVSMAPDVCLTPSKSGSPVPYPITHTMDLSHQCSPNVFAEGKAVYLDNESFVDRVKGDEPGAGKGVVSQTHIKISHNIDKSNSVFVNGQAIVRTGDTVWMNWRKPGQTDEEAAREAAAKKKACWDCRKDQLEAARKKLAEMPPGRERDRLAAAIDRYDRNRQGMEYALLSQHVYNFPQNANGPVPAPPPGWEVMTPEEMAQYGLKSSDLQIKDSNFGAQMYKPDPAVFGDDMKSTLAFKGTQNWEDWKNNFAQGLGRDSAYYKQTTQIGRKIQASGTEVTIAGHSLGGGLATAASGYSGSETWTFNAAGLHENTVTEMIDGKPVVHMPDPANVNAYQVAGEILTGIQEQGWGGTLAAAAVGAKFGGIKGALAGAALKMGLSALMPDAVGTKFGLPGTGMNPGDRHSMEQVIAGLQQQLDEDHTILAEATGKSCECECA